MRPVAWLLGAFSVVVVGLIVATVLNMVRDETRSRILEIPYAVLSLEAMLVPKANRDELLSRWRRELGEKLDENKEKPITALIVASWWLIKVPFKRDVGQGTKQRVIWRSIALAVVVLLAASAVGVSVRHFAGRDAGPGLTAQWSRLTGGAVVSTPAIANGVVYVTSDDQYLYAFQEATGRTLWRRNIGGRADSSPVVSGGIVYTGSWGRDTVDAFDAATGGRLWSFTTGSSIDSTPTLAAGALYVGSDDHNLYALNAITGKPIWVTNLDGVIAVRPALADGLVYVGTYDSDPKIGEMYALDTATGTIEWSQKITGPYIILARWWRVRRFTLEAGTATSGR